MINQIDTIPDQGAYDVIVIGAGAAGMAAALFAAIEKQKVLLIERTDFVGGTSALSAGSTWIPNSRHAQTVTDDDSLENTSRFLTGVVGNHSDAALRQAFLTSGPEAIETLETQSEVKFRPYATHPDYEQHVEGATLRGRALEPLPFDGLSLGGHLALLRPPIPEFTLLGGMMVDRTDIGHLLKVGKTLGSTRHAATILARYGRDRIAGSKRGTRLLMGNALTGRLLKSLLDRNVDILTETSVRALKSDHGGVSGVTFERQGSTREVRARRAIILAAGGFSNHRTRRAEMLHEATLSHSPAAPGHTGEMQDLALALGARFGEGSLDNAYWAPVSIRTRADGTKAVFPHFVLDRSKPGTICVNQKGERFVNESTSYHLFVRAMFEAHRASPAIPCFIITDAVGLKKYGLGMVRMGTRNLTSYLADGYLTEAATLDELAAKLGMDRAALDKSVATINESAASGVDSEFGRGTTPYHKINGDPGHTPNPTLGPIKNPPFYAVRLYPGDIGAATGLVINAWAQVLREAAQPIERLYACGNEAQSIMGGTYPGPGITLGPAITFAYRAVRHAIHGDRA